MNWDELRYTLLTAVVCLVITVIEGWVRWTHIHLTETELLLQFWPQHLVVMAIGGTYLLWRHQ